MGDHHANFDVTAVRQTDVPAYMIATEILKAWETSIRNKSGHPLSKFLNEDCEISYYGQSQVQNKEDHLKRCVENDKAKYIGDFQILHGNGVGCGSIA